MDTGHFIGTSTWWRHPLNFNVTYTDGAKYVAETGKAYWLLDRIALNEYKLPFSSWVLEVKDNKGTMTVTDGNENLVDQFDISYTDFPEPGITLWFIDNVILVPSEY